MSRTTTRFIGAAAALLAAGLAGFSLRAQPHTLTTVAARNPAAEVRTQVIRRTVHIVRHEHGRHAAGSRGIGATGPHYPGSGSGSASAVATHTSGSHYAASGAAVAADSPGAVTTRTSASHATAAGGPVASGAPVTTRTSASRAAGSERLHLLGRTRDHPHQLARRLRLGREGEHPFQRRRRRGRRRWRQWRLNPARF